MSRDDPIGYMEGIIKEVCEQFGPRASGDPSEKAAGDHIEAGMKTFCDATRQEAYTCHPKGFLGFIRFAALLALIAIILYVLSMAIELGWLAGDLLVHLGLLVPAVACAGFSMLYLIAQVMTYHHLPFIDALFPERTSNNIIGIVEPKGEVKRTVIVSGHHDSQHEFSLFYYLKTFGGLILYLGFFGIIVMTGIFSLRIILLLLAVPFTGFFTVFMVVSIIFIPIAISCMFFVNMKKPVLGGFDNMSGVAIAMAVAKRFSNERLAHTRVMAIAFAGEEAGLRGSFAFAKAHAAELQVSEHVMINLDGIGEAGFIRINNAEPLIGVKHDESLNQELLSVAKDLGIPASIAPLPFGASDAAPFRKVGVKATTINAFDLGSPIPHLPNYYHNRNDTPAVVQPEALRQAHDIVVECIKRMDAA